LKKKHKSNKCEQKRATLYICINDIMKEKSWSAKTQHSICA